MSAQQPPNFSQIVEQNLLNMKKRTSQVKGEYNDNLTEVIADNFKSFYQISQQLIAQMTQKDKEIGDLKKTLEKYESAHPELKITLDKKDPKMKTVTPENTAKGK